MSERRWSLFNVERYTEHRPSCCHVVPVLFRGEFRTEEVDGALLRLSTGGSMAAYGYDRPEGVVVYHAASGYLFKKTLGSDGHKGG